MKKFHNSLIRQFTGFKTQVRLKSWREQYFIKFLSSIGNLLWFLAKKGVKILIVSSFWLKLDDITVALSLSVLS